MKDLKERDDAEGSQEDDLQFVDEEEFSNADRKGKGRATDGNTAQLVSSRKRQRKATVSGEKYGFRRISADIYSQRKRRMMAHRLRNRRN